MKYQFSTKIKIIARVLFLGVVFALSITMLAGCGGSSIGDISAVAISPSGDYQAEVVQISYGATGGETAIFVETADENAFPIIGEQNTVNSIKIKETKTGWGTENEIEWISDNTFIARTGSKLMNYYKVEMDGKSYKVTEGLEVEESKCTFHERKIDGDSIEITATIYVKNTISENVFFIVRSYILTEGNPRGMVTATAENNLKTGEALMIGPNEEKYFEIKLFGTKKTNESFVDQMPDYAYVSITQIGNE